MQSANPNATPQFSTAEYHNQSQVDRCSFCGLNITGYYYRIGGSMACAGCAEQKKYDLPQDDHASFMRALLFGIGGAIAGLILYSGFVILTDIIIGWLALGVGFIVAKSMMVGSKNIGGRRYQIAAVLLTYAAVSMSSIPIAYHYFWQQRDAQKTIQTAPEQASTDALSAQTASTDDQTAGQQQPTQPRSALSILGYLAAMGLASPFILVTKDPGHGFIGLVILLVGIRIAWLVARGSSDLGIYGPFESSKATSA
jgi:hypothetical protein